MSLFRIFDIAGSAMSAQSVRLNATASNLANAESVSSSAETTYRARRPVFASALADVMQGEKERTCELLFRPCSHTACDCGLEGGDRRRACEPECPRKKDKGRRTKEE